MVKIGFFLSAPRVATISRYCGKITLLSAKQILYKVLPSHLRPSDPKGNSAWTFNENYMSFLAKAYYRLGAKSYLMALYSFK